MKLTKSQFKEELGNPKNRNHIIIFLGMSSTGKTHWSKLLSEKFGLNHVEFDDLIGESDEFTKLIKNIPGSTSSERLGLFFGKPWDVEFNSKEEKYLAIEEKFMSKKYPPGTVLDLTGSAIYHPEQLREMVKTGLVIFLETIEEAQKIMLQNYIADPKPVCWKGLFKKKNNESTEEALIRCFSLLIKTREKEYEKFADVKIPYNFYRNLKNLEDFVEKVSEQLN